MANNKATAKLRWITADHLRLKLKAVNRDCVLNKEYPSVQLPAGFTIIDTEGDAIEGVVSFASISKGYLIRFEGVDYLFEEQVPERPLEQDPPNVDTSMPQVHVGADLLQNRRITFGSNGIDLENGVVLERQDLVKTAAKFLESFQFLVIGAPPAYGKTSLLQLVERDFKSRGVHVVRLRLASTDPVTVNNNLKNFTGIDLLEKDIDNYRPGAQKVIMLDDAHEQYGLEDFWKALIKDFPTWPGGKEYSFIFSVTYNLDVGGSPATFSDPAVPRLSAANLVLKQEEAAELYDMYLVALARPWTDFQQLKTSILSDSGGQVGVITSILLFLDHSKRTLAHPPKTETGLLRLLFARDYLRDLRRCFSFSDTSDGNPLTLLADVFINGRRVIQYASEAEKDYYRTLVRGGVLTGVENPRGSEGEFSFTSPVAKRVFYEYLFPGRASPDVQWVNIGDLVIAAVKTMSWGLLQDSKKSSSAQIKFPKEAAFQHLLMGGLAQNLHASAAVAPEVSQSWDTGKTIEGGLDFFVNGDLMWGIELLKQGAGIGEHIARFGPNGKYKMLNAKQFIVVDFRPMKHGKRTNVQRQPERLTFFFSEDCHNVEYVHGKAEGKFTLPP